jgi:hypothetical protein
MGGSLAKALANRGVSAMQITTPRELCELQLPSGPIVVLYQEDGRFYTKQELPDDESFVVEITAPAAAYEYYLFAADAGKCLSSFPEPVPQPVAPPERPAPAPLPAGEARRIRRAAGVTQKSLAAEIGVSEHQVSVWEQAGASLSPMRRGGRSAEYCAKFRRYVEALTTMEGYEPLKRPGAVAASPDGKRRCSHPGCGAILSRFNDGDRCACHE